MTTPSLSEALLEGRKGVPRGFGRLIDIEWDSDGIPFVGSACDLGAMALGFGEDLQDIDCDGALWWPADAPEPLLSPPCSGTDSCDFTREAARVVSHLNDIHGSEWPTERVAAWLRETVEPLMDGFGS